MKVEFPNDDVKTQYYREQLSKLSKVKVVKVSTDCQHLKEGMQVKIMMGRVGEPLFDADYLIYFESDISCIWPNDGH